MNEIAYKALREQAAFLDLTGRGQIRVVGEDRVRFLHAMATNHIEQLQPGTGCYTFFLTAQGRIVADGNVFGMPDYLLLDTEPEIKQRLWEHLDRFIIADDVVLEDFTDTTAVVNVEGPLAEQLLGDTGAPTANLPHSLIEWNKRLVAKVSYTGGPGYSILLPVEDKAELIASLTDSGIPQADRETADAVRLEFGHPRYGVDILDTNILQETQQMRAVHFSKGCYIGQEIVERVRSRGHVNKLLTQIEIEGDQLRGETKVEMNGKDVGTITSSAYSPASGKVYALALLRAEAAQPGSALTVDGAGATVTVRRSA